MNPYRSNKFATVIDIIRKVKNWPEILQRRLLKNQGEEYSVSFRSGVTISCRSESEGDWRVLHELFFRKSYHRAINFIKGAKSPVVLDLGGNIGCFSILVKQLLPNASVWAFEPGDENARMYERNISNNRLTTNGVELMRSAVEAKERTSFWHFDSENPGGSYMSDENHGNGVPVQFTDLEQWVADKGISQIDLLKIDIEGGEYELVFETGEAFWSLVRCISIEVHERKEGKSIQDLLNKLQGYGFMIEEEDVITYFCYKTSS